MAETRIAKIGSLELDLGGEIADTEIAYLTYGKLNPARDNVILLTHGYTTAHTFCEGGATASEASWHDVVGAGKPIDTDHYFVVSSNMIGSSFGSTGPKSTCPQTGKPYGLRFPEITLKDIVHAQKRLLDNLGIDHLLAVVGPSYGGMQAFSWAVEYPDMMRGIVAAIVGLGGPPPGTLRRFEEILSADPNWHGGDYYENGGVHGTMTTLREGTLRSYGIDEQLRETFRSEEVRDAEIRRIAAVWADEFDANSLFTLGRAMMRFDPSPDLHRIRAKVLYVLSRTDEIFPPSLASSVMPALREAGVDAHYFELDSQHGHLATGMDAAKWADPLRRFLDELSA